MTDPGHIKHGHPESIDIYVDGCWLSQGKNNPKETGGWGAVIIESGVPGFLSGNVKEEDVGSNNATELAAVLKTLLSIRQKKLLTPPRPRITLYTDQIDLVSYLAAKRRDPSSDSAAFNRVLRKMGYYLDAIEDSATELGVEIKYAKGARIIKNPEQDWMAVAHSLASKAAWKARLEEQGHIYLPGYGQLAGEKARSSIENMSPASMHERQR